MWLCPQLWSIVLWADPANMWVMNSAGSEATGEAHWPTLTQVETSWWRGKHSVFSVSGLWTSISLGSVSLDIPSDSEAPMESLEAVLLPRLL